MRFWRAVVDGTTYPVYSLPHQGAPGACELLDLDQGPCSGREWTTGVAGDLSIVLCDAHFGDLVEVSEEEYDALVAKMGASGTQGHT